MSKERRLSEGIGSAKETTLNTELPAIRVQLRKYMENYMLRIVKEAALTISISIPNSWVFSRFLITFFKKR